MYKSIKSWFPIKNIENGIVELKDNKFCKILEIYPINFSLKSESERESILYQYKNFLNTCNFDMQILVHSKKGNLDNHIKMVEENIKIEKCDKTKKLMEEYINIIKTDSLKNAISKQFFIVITSETEKGKKVNKEHIMLDLNEKTLKVKDAISKCGNYVKEFDKDNNEIIDLFYTYMNPTLSNLQKITDYDYVYKGRNSNYIKNDLLDYILPGCIDFSNPRYLNMDEMCFSGLIVTNFSPKQKSGWILPLFNLSFDANISLFYEKLNSTKVIRELTYYIGDIGGAIKTVNSNQMDIDVVKKSYDDAKYIRHQMQVEKEDLYNLCIYLSVFSKNLEELMFNLTRLEGICATMGLQTRRALFRQEQLFNVILPVGKNIEDIKRSASRNVLTSSLASTYPFASSELYDDSGILIGENTQNNSLIVIDRFDSRKYKNPNMCILGTSGAGKSFFAKLMLLRNRYLNISQFVIDPEGEYKKVCDELGGTYIKIGQDSENYINIMDIRENDFSDEEEKSGYLTNKLNKLKPFFSLIFTEMNYEESVLLEEKIIESYAAKGIFFNDESLYVERDDKIRLKKVFKSYEDMPTIGDLYECLERNDMTRNLALQLKPYVNGSMSFFNHHTNIDINNKLVVADTSKLEKESISLGMYVVVDLFWDRIKKNKNEKKIIYIDEIWRLIGSSGNEKTAEFIYTIFKTIRKYGGAATAITQDISDFFSLQDGKYGKAIVNNSALKFILQLEEEDIRILKDVLDISNEEILKIKNFNRGYGLLFSNKNRVVSKISANKFEYGLITTDRNERNLKIANHS